MSAPLQRLHLLSLKIVRVENGVHATFGGRGMTPEDLGAMTRALAAELLSATSPCRASESPDAGSPDTGRCPA